MRLSPNTILAQHPAVAWRVVEGCAIALQPPSPKGSPQLLTFNDTGTIIWNLLDGRTSVEAMLARLAEWYPQTPREQQRIETYALLERLLAAGVVIPQEETAP